MDLNNATLILRTANASINQGGTNNFLTWNNIDLKILVGTTMWSKYNKFKLTMTFSASGPQLGITDENRFVNVNLEGLPWVNSSYDTSMNSNRSRAVVGVVEYSTIGVTTYLSNQAGYIFEKEPSIVNLRLILSKVTDDGIVPTQYSGAVFVFSIVGVEE